MSIHKGFGFIEYPPNNLFFHYQNLENVDFNDLKVGDKVSFTIERNERGEDIAANINLMQ
jgi:cold shock CspA family protein